MIWLLLLAAAVPERIVSTAPSFTEMLFALGAGDRVVAVSTYCHYPPAVDRLPRIGTYLEPNVEAIIRLRPNLVLVHAEHPQIVRQLRAAGIATLALRNTTLDETLRSATTIGQAAGRPREGSALEAKLRQSLDALRRQTAGPSPPTLLFIVGRTPGRLDGMLAVGKGSYLNDLIAAAGGRNVLADSPVAYPKISVEGVLRLNPDVIVDMGDMTFTQGVSPAHTAAVVRLWNTIPGLRAAQRQKIFAVASDIYVVPGPRVVDAAAAFRTMLQ
jgi:iron complex transport system substrate-binding protein